MALRIVRLFWWHAKQFACPHYQHSLPLSLALSLSLFYFPLLLCFYQKFVTLKNTQRQKTEPTEFTTMNQQFGAGQREPNAPRERERENSALPCRRRKSFVLPPPRVASALLGWRCCCCCCWSLRTATAAADVQFCFQRRHDWTRALQESRSRTLKSRQKLRCVCVCHCIAVCAYVSRCCVCPSRRCRKKL